MSSIQSETRLLHAVTSRFQLTEHYQFVIINIGNQSLTNKMNDLTLNGNDLCSVVTLKLLVSEKNRNYEQ